MSDLFPKTHTPFVVNFISSRYTYHCSSAEFTGAKVGQLALKIIINLLISLYINCPYNFRQVLNWLPNVLGPEFSGENSWREPQGGNKIHFHFAYVNFFLSFLRVKKIIRNRSFLWRHCKLGNQNKLKFFLFLLLLNDNKSS